MLLCKDRERFSTASETNVATPTGFGIFITNVMHSYGLNTATNWLDIIQLVLSFRRSQATGVLLIYKK
jgi:hypothetical protein